MSATGPAIVAEAKRWVGVPWHHQASIKAGCDCIGLVVGVADSLGMPEAAAWRADTRFRGYGPTPVPEKLLEACDVYLDRIAVVAATLGDILLFAFQRDPMHFGIISATDPVYVIHAYQPRDKVVENSLTGPWPRRVIGAYRYRGKVNV